MSDFIHPKDYDATIRKELLESITRLDAPVLEMSEDVAVLEMMPYLSAYDVDVIFAPYVIGTPDTRNMLVLMYAKDITIYHASVALFGSKINTLRQTRYDRAIEWCKEVAKGTITPHGLPLKPIDLNATTTPVNNSIIIGGNPKQNNYY